MKLNKTLVLTALMLITLNLSAQKDEQRNDEGMQYLFDGNLHITGFGGVTVDLTSIEGDPSVAVGGGGAAVINQKFFIGGYGQGITTIHERKNIAINEEEIDEAMLQFGHGGLWLGYIIQPARVLHMNVNAKIGGGELSLNESLDEYDMFDSYHRDAVFVMSPSVGVDVNILPWFRIAANAGYRVVSGVSGKTYDDSDKKIFKSEDYNGAVFSMSFLFGNFK